MTDKIEKMSFEEAFTAMDNTLRKLEAGDLPLIEAMKLYEEGMALAKQCGLQLDDAELRLKKLTPSGALETFDTDNEQLTINN